MTSTALNDQFAVCTPEEEEAFKAIEARQNESGSGRVISSQRERFEAWAKSKNYLLSESKISGDGMTYRYSTTEAAWRGYQAACPESYQCVPTEPTHNMLEASGYDVSIEAVEAWQAMLAAAPKPGDV